MIDDISFKQYTKKSDIHGTSLYPAVMIAPVQNAILNSLIRKNNIYSVFDPFHGSGTALYECAEISKDISLIGCDINPLANLMTKVKLQGVNERFTEDLLLLRQIIYNLPHGEEYEFTNMQKWFKKDVIESLRVLRTAIMQIQNDQNRLFFWYMICDIVRRYSNTRSSTYKLHLRDDADIKRIQNNVINDYLSSIEKSWPKFCNCYNNFTLYKCDIIEQIKRFDDNSFDITITSPPYGDNNTTVPYGQFSILSLFWIDEKDLELEGWELETYSKIDSKSIGGCTSKNELTIRDLQLIQPYLDNISEYKHKKVKIFFSDYFKVLKEICRVTGKYIVLTLGNRTVDGKKINLNDVTKKYLEQNDYTLFQYYERELYHKRTPKITSSVRNKPVESMNSEFVSIYRKK